MSNQEYALAEKVELFPAMETGYKQCRAFLDSIEIPLAFVDDSFCIVKLNRTYQTQCEHDFAELIGKSVFACLPLLSDVPEDIAGLFSSRHTEVSCNVLDDLGRFYNISVRRFIDEHGNQLAAVIAHQFRFEDDLFQQMLREKGDYLGLVECIDKVLEATREDLFAVAVQQAVRLTQSEIGYLHFFDESSNSISYGIWSDGDSAMSSSVENQFIKLDDTGEWVDCIRNKKPQYNNQYPAGETKKGFTNGYFDVEKNLSVPVVYEGKVVAVLGVANCKSNYSINDAKLLKLFSTVMWHASEMPRMFDQIVKQSELLKRQRTQISRSLFDLIGAISETLELKDVYTAGHQKSVSEISVKIGMRLGLTKFELEGLRLGALVHDIGKVGIPSDILSKPSKLSAEEYNLVKTHSTLGADVVGKVRFPWPIRQMILQHHERLDGTGYPLGLKGDEIIKEARIIAVADVCDSILSHRPYRPSLGLKELKSELISGRGTKYQSDVVDACFDVLEHDKVALHDVVGHLKLLPVSIANMTTPLIELRKQMAHKKTKHVAIMDKTQVKGMIDNYIVEHWLSPIVNDQSNQSFEQSMLQQCASKIMNENFVSTKWDTLVDEAFQLMIDADSDYLLVLSSQGIPKGVLSWRIIAEAKQAEIQS